MRSVKSFIAAGAATLIVVRRRSPPTWPIAAASRMRRRWLRTSAAGICAATSASAISASIASNNALDAHPLRHRCRRTTSTPRASSASASVTSSTTGSAPTSPVSIARQFARSRHRRHHLRRRRRHRHAITAPSREWVVLANAYADLGTWWCITPFIGAGVGGARVTINGFTRRGHRQHRRRRAAERAPTRDNASKWNLAWAVHAGLAYKVTPNFTVELAYRAISIWATA